MSKNKHNAKREAYAKKQEEQGKKVVAWIFGVLIVLAIVYMIWTFLHDLDFLNDGIMALEIERKFLVLDDSYKHEAFSKSHIVQGYICSERGRTVRVRIRDDRAYLTIKGPSENGGLSRYEFEREIPLEDGKQMMQLCEPGIIDKTRWLVKSGRRGDG